ncbi:MAG: hypothetical protein QM522_02760 [Chitinophagaceae bacterium]|jgi:hypothetical protein|nr:hypothetical protein [Chitinophagaceae bacterium]
MAADPFDALRLALMQDVLPVGLGAVDRVRKGGPAELLAALTAGEGDPVARLREEGEPAASRLRQQLDQLSPGLGNPVMKVEVRDVQPESPMAVSTVAADGSRPSDAELQCRLQLIEQRLRLLEQRL